MTQTCKSCLYRDMDIYEESGLNVIHCVKHHVPDVNMSLGQLPRKACSTYKNYYTAQSLYALKLNHPFIQYDRPKLGVALSGWRGYRKEYNVI